MRTMLVGVLAAAAASCGPAPSLDRLQEARRLAGELRAELATSVETGQRAVMAADDASAAASAGESSAAIERIAAGARTLGQALSGLGYDTEAATVDAFVQDLDAYRTLNRRILALAVESTNLKAQRLSFGAAWDAADRLDQVVAGLAGSDIDRRRLAATAMAAVREMQALQAPHIAEPDDATMTRLEARMEAAESRAVTAVDALARTRADTADSTTDAAAALSRFLDVHREIVALSRRNTNVQALALSLSQRTTLAAACQSRVADLQGALAARRLGGTR